MKFRAPKSVRERLRPFGRPRASVIRDEYFDYPDRRLSKARRPNGCIRLRTKGHRHELAVKRDHFAHGKYVYSDEFEVGVADPRTARLILRRLGFLPLVRFRIRRQVWRKADITITLDRVSGLGEFLELEILAPRALPKKARTRLGAVLGTLGLSPKDELQMGNLELWQRKG